MSNARRGLNLLLKAYPGADVVEVKHQGYSEELARNALLPDSVTTVGNGPWTQVTLRQPGGLVEYAIWNATGAVHRTDQYGAVADDPFITPPSVPPHHE